MLGGAFGTLLRYGLHHYSFHLFSSTFPIGTSIINTLGCFILGLLSVLPAHTFPYDMTGKLFLTAGFCGAFTTFSTFILETIHCMESGHMGAGWLNIILSVVLGLLFLRLGMMTGTLWVH